MICRIHNASSRHTLRLITGVNFRSNGRQSRILSGPTSSPQSTRAWKLAPDLAAYLYNLQLLASVGRAPT